MLNLLFSPVLYFLAGALFIYLLIVILRYILGILDIQLLPIKFQFSVCFSFFNDLIVFIVFLDFEFV